MNAGAWMTNGFEWVLQASWKASVLVLLVLAVQWILGRRLTPRWRYGLWVIVLVRLLAPQLPQSSWSVFSVVRPAVAPSAPAMVAVTSVESEAPSTSTEGQSAVDTSAGGPSSSPGELPIEPRPGVSNPVAASAQPIWSPSLTPPSLPRTPTDWRIWFALGWMVGVVVLGGRNLIRHLRFRRRVSRAAVVTDARLLEIVGDARRDLRIRRPVAVLETPLVTSPTLYGNLRPALLMPPGLVSRLAPSESYHVVLHELLHHKRGDAWVNLLVSTLCQLHWFNPLLWVAAWRVRVDMEMACDAAVMARLPQGHSRLYGETILKCLESWVASAGGSGLRMLSRQGEMRQRIDWIARFSGSRRSLWVALGTATLLALLGLTDPRLLSSNQAAGADALVTGRNAAQRAAPDWRQLDPTEAKPQWHLFVRDDQDGSGIQGATIHVRCALKDGSEVEFQGTTDGRGSWSLEQPEKFQRILTTEASSAGYVTQKYTANRPAGLDWRLAGQFRLSPVQDTAGEIVDPSGVPIAGATVTAISEGEWGPSVTTFGTGMATTSSDSEGRWCLSGLHPACIFKICVAHPEYSPRTNECLGKLVATSQRRRSYLGTNTTLLLAKATTIRGRVVDEVGAGITGASVSVVQQLPASYRTNTYSARDGAFSLEFVPPDYRRIPPSRSGNAHAPGIALLAAAEGFAPMLKTIPPEFSVVEDLRIVLDRGVELEVFVKDEDGQPIAGAEVMGAIDFTAITDEHGRIAWEHVPKDALKVLVRKEGCKTMTSSSLRPMPETNVITLVRSARIQGTVSDSSTGASVESFRVTVLPEGSRAIVPGEPPYLRTNFTRGQLLLPANPLRRIGSQCRLLVEAPDYRQLLTDKIEIGDRDVDLVLSLQPQAWIRGVVVSDAGKPVEGAEVSYVASGLASRRPGPGDSLELLRQIIGSPLKTRVDGAFEFPRVESSVVETLRGQERLRLEASLPEDLPAALRERLSAQTREPQSAAGDFIVVKHESGFAEFPVDRLPAGGRIVLQSTGSVKARVGGAPSIQPQYGVNLSRQVDARAQVTSSGPGSEGPQGQILCDEQGCFEARGLLAGVYDLTVFFPVGLGAWTSIHRTQIDVQPGRVTEVEVLAGTRLAHGRILSEPADVNIDWTGLFTTATPWAATFNGAAFSRSGFSAKGGMKLITPLSVAKDGETAGLGQTLPVRFLQDGTFLTANLQPGSYELSLTIAEAAPRLIDGFRVRGVDNRRIMTGSSNRFRRFIPPGMKIFELLDNASRSQKDVAGWVQDAVPVGYFRSKVDIPGGSVGEMVDLGDFTLVTSRRPVLRAMAPVFRVSTFDGGSLGLSDFAGKWLVLAFWHGGAPTCQTELMGLRMLWREFQANERLAMALIALDEDLEKARAAAKEGPACPQGYAGPWQTSSVVKDYGVIAVPSIFLIDPEGNIAGYNLTAASLAEVLDQIVAKETKPSLAEAP